MKQVRLARSMREITHNALLLCLLLFSSLLSADMQPMTDDDLSEVDGAGIGFVLEDFVFSHRNAPSIGNHFNITGIRLSNGQEANFTVRQFYIARAGSNYGENLQGVNIGRVNNPWELDILDGNNLDFFANEDNKAVLQLAAPTQVAANVGYDCVNPNATAGTGTCSSRPASASFENGERPDIGIETFAYVPRGVNGSAGGGKWWNFNVHIESAVLDGSYLRFWGEDGRAAGAVRLNLYTPTIKVSTCNGNGCASEITLSNVEVQANVGFDFQPAHLGVNTDQIGLNLEITALTHPYINNINSGGWSDGSSQGQQAYDFFWDFYTNSDKHTNVYIGDVDVNGTSLGWSRISGLKIQYLNATLRDIN